MPQYFPSGDDAIEIVYQHMQSVALEAEAPAPPHEVRSARYRALCAVKQALEWLEAAHASGLLSDCSEGAVEYYFEEWCCLECAWSE